ncbi:MAG TPA: hypothetical protein VNN79_09180, partial [Actinomycetota bacterium]|nr:hypothetical protein [Actinomycetota bacterium]
VSNLLASGTVDVTPVITHRFGLEEFEQAFEAMDSGRSGKVLLLPNGPPANGDPTAAAAR